MTLGFIQRILKGISRQAPGHVFRKRGNLQKTINPMKVNITKA